MSALRSRVHVAPQGPFAYRTDLHPELEVIQVMQVISFDLPNQLAISKDLDNNIKLPPSKCPTLPRANV
jgi:hypothetical protein